jgi:UDP-sugar diphosphatase
MRFHLIASDNKCFLFYTILQDLIRAHDSVAIITFNTTRNTLICVKQFRPAVYYGLISEEFEKTGVIDYEKFPPKNAITLELCAGIIDKNLPNAEIAREELIEECGYDISVDRLEEVMSFRSGVGTNGALQIMYYVEVTDDDRINSGGGVQDEIIEVVELTIPEARDLLKQGSTHSSPPAFLFGILWFLTNKAPKFNL